jgi:hypothetical protein
LFPPCEIPHAAGRLECAGRAGSRPPRDRGGSDDRQEARESV